MMIGALHPYETALQYRAELHLHAADGRTIPLDMARYLAPCDEVDHDIVHRCRTRIATGDHTGVLDIGCGPGRMVHALSAGGIIALGIDIAHTAVDLTRARGASALLRDLFARVPAQGRWGTALLLDGNVGIGGDVDRLLARLAVLLAPDGCAIIETAPDRTVDERLQVRFARGGRSVGPVFPWAVIGAQPLARRAVLHGFHPRERWTTGDRTFLEIHRTGSDSSQISATRRVSH